MKEQWQEYDPNGFYDELITANKRPRRHANAVVNHFSNLTCEETLRIKEAADLVIRDMGISFTVYSEGTNIDRAWPFDVVPRIIRKKEWDAVSAGLQQRSLALNRFIHDVYNKQMAFSDGIVPAELVLESDNFKPQCSGAKPRYGAWAHICGTDLVRAGDGEFYVLEDNLRVPSGVSYMLENREVTRRTLPELFENRSVYPVDDYPEQLYRMLCSLSPRRIKKPTIAVLTPGIYNSAYFEHAFLAQSIGAQLVEGQDLFVDQDNTVFMRTVDGPSRVDVVYRRIDDDFLDPEVFRPDSTLGVPGIMRAWFAGNVAIANAPGSGVADDKVIYAFIPALIRYYLDEEPLLKNVKTYLCMNEDDKQYVLDNIANLVVKPANESGGYGIMVGPKSTKKKHQEFAALIKKNPRNYIAQPTLDLSTAPTLCGSSIAPRHLDLRPFILHGSDTWVTSGGLTRVAMQEGSLVVNSSQGGGSKDTWIVD